MNRKITLIAAGVLMILATGIFFMKKGNGNASSNLAIPQEPQSSDPSGIVAGVEDSSQNDPVASEGSGSLDPAAQPEPDGGFLGKLTSVFDEIASLKKKLGKLDDKYGDGYLELRSDSITNDNIKKNAVNSSSIENKSIREEDLKDGSISDPRLIPDGFIESLKIKDATITDADISPDAQIDSSKINLGGYALANLPTDEEKAKLGEIVDDAQTSIAIGDKNISQIHNQNTDTGTNSNTFTIGNSGHDLSLVFGASSEKLTYDDSSGAFALSDKLSLSSNKLTDLGVPTADTDAATKGYVDNQLSTEIGNLKWKDPVGSFSDLSDCDDSHDGQARLVKDENWIYRCDKDDSVWHKVANVASVDHNDLKNRDASGSHPASAISFSDHGTLNSDDVQDAINDLDDNTLKLNPTGSQTIDYDSNISTVIKMYSSQADAPFRIENSSGSSKFAITKDGLVSTPSVTNDSIVDASITGTKLASNISIATTGSVSASTVASTIATGTKPFTVASVTKVDNLNADLIDGMNSSLAGGASVILATDTSGNLTLANGKISVETIRFEAETTAPTAEEGKAYYDSNDKTFKVYNSQGDGYIDLVADPHIAPSHCPDGYVPVPGDARYGTAGGFCVMKYEAKCAATSDAATGLMTPATAYQTYDNATTACTSANSKQVVSTASGYPIANINQTNAKAYCVSSGGHLITNNEWMTIARNMEKQPSNWTGASVGTGGLYRGHSDNSPATALSASTDDGDGYSGTGDSGTSEERRTMTLSNGETVWDMSGDVWEWASDTIRRKDQPHSTAGSGNSFGWKEFTTLDDYGQMSYANLRPGNPAWNSSQNAGQIYTYNPSGDTGNTVYAFLRGGDWVYGSNTGLFGLNLGYAPANTYSSFGFRCVSPGD
ncbi:MAG: formylglycine-generating enzyme family protein [Candidatus Moranbacteria bacterium]|nr:formylglycine-generating enzyme family protein [Candidatus Moranbacteria bacterium]